MNTETPCSDLSWGMFATPPPRRNCSRMCLFAHCEGRHRLNDALATKTWLFSIARNLCLDKLRRNKHRNHASFESSSREDGATIQE